MDNSVNGSFEFVADETATFECRMDGAAFEACPSPQPYLGLGDGTHTFEVRAVDLAGNLDPTAIKLEPFASSAALLIDVMSVAVGAA